MNSSRGGYSVLAGTAEGAGSLELQLDLWGCWEEGEPQQDLQGPRCGGRVASSRQGQRSPQEPEGLPCTALGQWVEGRNEPRGPPSSRGTGAQAGVQVQRNRGTQPTEGKRIRQLLPGRRILSRIQKEVKKNGAPESPGKLLRRRGAQRPCKYRGKHAWPLWPLEKRQEWEQL